MATTRHQAEKYHLLSDGGDSDSGEILSQTPCLRGTLSMGSTLSLIFRALCAFSIMLNVFFLVRKEHHEGSKWARLVYDVPTSIYSSTEYGPAIGTEAERDRRWEALDTSEGIIAMPDLVALKYGLPLSERFPWDQTQGVYLLGAHHDIHCLKRIYEYVSDTHKGRSSSLSYEHIVHCLDNMLHNVYCHADDPPWMQLPPQPYRQKYPEYQTRQCKSWDKFMTWARQYNACYQNENIRDADGNPTDDAFEHFKYCPPGSPYFPLVEKFMAQKAQGINATEAYDASQQDG